MLDSKKPSGEITISEKTIKELGMNGAVIYAGLVKKSNGSFEPFRCTVQELKEFSGLGATGQRDTLKKIEDKGFIKVEYIGLPRKRYIRILK